MSQEILVIKQQHLHILVVLRGMGTIVLYVLMYQCWEQG
jgi:hypothetical protein